jgi:hypothetical protein
MMLGKRSGRPSPTARQHMRRTTSLTEFAAPDKVLADVAEEEDEELQLLPAHAEAAELEGPYGWAIGGAAAAGRADWLAAYRARAAPALAGLRRNSADFSAAETAAFLRACGLCNRRLGPGRDTFVYRYAGALLSALSSAFTFLFLACMDENQESMDLSCRLQGRHGVLQPRVPAAAHHDRGVEGEVRACHAAGVRPGGAATAQAQRRGLRQTRDGPSLQVLAA